MGMQLGKCWFASLFSAGLEFADPLEASPSWLFSLLRVFWV